MPVIEDKTNLTLDELKTIIRGLRMSTFSFVEDNAMDEIRGMIKALPSPEQIDTMANSPKTVKNLQKSIGNIMQLIETYGKRDIEYKVRYRSRTNLPPRYKVLEWRGAMKSKEEVKANLVIGMVKLSADLDNDGYSKLSQSIINCAKDVQKGKLPVKELYDTTNNIIEAFGSKELVKEAQYKGPAQLDLSMEEIHGSIAQINQMLQGLNTAFQNKVQYLSQIEKTKTYGDQLNKIWQQVGVLAPVLADVDKQASTVEQTMNEKVPLQSIAQPGSPTQQMQYIPDPENPASGWQIAITQTKDGKWNEVQVDESTGQYSYAPLTPLKIPATLQKNGNPLLKPPDAKLVLDYVMQKAANSSLVIRKISAVAQVAGGTQPSAPTAAPTAGKENSNVKAWKQYIDSIIQTYPNHYKLFLEPIKKMLKQKSGQPADATPAEATPSPSGAIPPSVADTPPAKAPAAEPTPTVNTGAKTVPMPQGWNVENSTKFNLRMHKKAKKS